MEVPFEQIGPGQIGRLAYQVIGQHGPIFNPRNIRYMPPAQFSGEFATAGAGPLLGLAGVNLAASCGVLALQAVTLRRIEEVSRKLDVVVSAVERVDVRLQDIQRRVERIDTKMAESHLREAIDHALTKAVRANEIGIEPLLCLVGDIESFIDATERPLIFNFAIRLSSDVRSKLLAIHRFLYGLRAFVAERHNIAVAGHPVNVMVVDSTRQYVDSDVTARSATAWYLFMERMKEVADEVGQGVYDNFTFADEEDQAKIVTEVVNKTWEASKVFGDAPDAGYLLWNNTSNFVDEEVESFQELQAFLCTVAREWLVESDGGVIYRTYKELEALREGYSSTFYRHLQSDAVSHGSGILEGGCDVAKLAA